MTSVMVSELYPIIRNLSDVLSAAYDNCGTTEKMARLGGAAWDCDCWLIAYDKGERGATYLAGFNAVCEALDAFADCGYEINTGDVWT